MPSTPTRQWVKPLTRSQAAVSMRRLCAVLVRCAVTCVLTITAILFVAYLVFLARYTYPERSPLAVPPALPPLPAHPPLFSRYQAALLRLPQHHWHNEQPQPDERFLFVAGHSSCTSVASHSVDELGLRPAIAAGWGNAMQELILNSYLAYKAGRSCVTCLLPAYLRQHLVL